MEREVTYRLQIWMTDPNEERIDILAMDAGDMRYCLEVEPGYVLQVN